ncbi:MAG: iron uptake porin [Cyanobacteriota bacterium]|nr:iron uptake porin [Cyanobacteriota bacterium]
MRPFPRPAIARGAIRLGALALALAPLGAGAGELPLAEMARYGSARGTPPQDSCVADGALRGEGPLSRWEAAALLQACLKQATAPTDQLQALQQQFQVELAQVAGRLEKEEERVEALEAQAFSTTTTLSGQAIFQLLADGFGGSSMETIREYRRDYGAVRMVYDVDLYFDTSFRGRDVLSIDTTVNDLNRSGGDGESTQVVSVNRLFYQFPSGPFTLTVGGVVSQDDMLAVWPSVYPAETVLNVLTRNGAPGAYNQEVGPGIGIWRQLDGFSLSANYVAQVVDDSEDLSDGSSTHLSGGTATVQLAYSAAQWTVALIYSHIQNGNDVIDEATGFVRDSYGFAGTTSAFGLSGFWQPDASGWIPSISAGWGLNLSHYEDRDDAGQVGISQSWSVGLQWRDAFLEGNVIGMAVGQAPFATHLKGGATPNDGNLVWELWALWQVSDAISITPALFYKSRPLGQFTPEGTTFHQLGVLLKTNIDF